jgi:nitroreductase
MDLKHRPDVMEFLLTRRSRPAKTLTGPGPDRATLETLLTAAARSPDHGKLEPWRFIVLEGEALSRLDALTQERGAARGEDPAKLAKVSAAWRGAPIAIAVVASPKPTDKFPEIEQHLSAGAVCLALVNAALASGWGANWLTAWMAYDRPFLETGLGLAEHEWIAGYIHIGSETAAPPERPRPDVAAITTWVST